jgi:hypothetical protein
MATKAFLEKAYLAYFGRPVDPTGLTDYAASTDTQVADAFAASAESKALYGTTFDYAQINAIYLALFGRAAEKAGLEYWYAKVKDGTFTPAGAAVAILNGALNADKIAIDNKLVASAAFTAALDTAAEMIGYSGAAAAASARSFLSTVTTTAATSAAVDAAVAAVVAAKTAVPSQTFTLTTGSDILAGTSGNDVFNGIMDASNGANNTLTVLDTVAGGDGTDTLNIIVNAYADNDTEPAATFSGIEVVNIRAIDATTTDTFVMNANNMGGPTTYNSDRSSSEITLNNLAAGTSVGIIGNASATQAALIAAYKASATAGTLNISNGTLGTAALNMTGTGLQTIAITSTGAANVVGSITTDSAVMTGVTINATTALSTGGIVITNSNATISTESLTVTGAASNVAASASAATRAAVVLGTLDSDFTTIDASGMSAGGVSATLSATASANFTGGAGNDSVTTGAGDITGTISGGAGTGDRLILAASAHISIVAEGVKYTNFEILQAADGQSLDMDLLTGSTTTAIEINDASDGATSITDMTATQAANVTFLDFNNVATLGVKNATTVGNVDVLNITISDGDTTTSENLIAATTDGADWTIAGVETINLIVVDDFDADALNNITGMTRLTATGAGDVDIITGAVDLGANGAVDFSGITGAITFNAAALATNAFAYIGGTKVDAVTDNAIGGNQITLGAGADTLTLTDKAGGSATTVVTGGAGADTITVAMTGNVNRDAMKFVFAAGDSVSDTTTTGISATLTDIITGMEGSTLSANAGTAATIDTNVSATAITFAAAANPTFGTTTVTNAGDFFINIVSTTVVNIYQDTDGDRIIEAGEFALTLTGILNSGMLNADFTITTGDLILATT